MASIFTRIINREIPGYIVAEDENYIAFLDAFPLRHGHTLVVPKQEADYIFDLDDEQYTGLQLFAKKVAKAVKAAVPCKRIGVAVIGLEVPHVHIHLVPMNEVSDLNFAQPKMQVAKEDMEAIAERIKAQL